MKFRKKPVLVEAFQMTLANRKGDAEWPAWLQGAWRRGDLREKDSYPYTPSPNQPLEIVTLEGTMRVNWGDWIIQGVQGELYPCDPDIFEKTYERVSDGLQEND